MARLSRRGSDATDSGMKRAYRLSTVLAVLLLVAGAGGLFVPHLYRDAPLWAAQARGVNLVDLIIALPTLVMAVALSARGSVSARLVWLGVLGYVLYDQVIFAFDISFNSLFLVYVALLSLSVFSLLRILTASDIAQFRLRIPSRPLIKSVGVYLVMVAALFFLAWMKDILPATFGNTTPSTITQAKIPSNPVYVLELGFLIPLYLLGAVWLVRGRDWGYLLAGPLLVLNALLSLSIISSTLFQRASDTSISLAIVPMFGIIAAVSAALARLYLRSLRRLS